MPARTVTPAAARRPFTRSCDGSASRTLRSLRPPAARRTRMVTTGVPPTRRTASETRGRAERDEALVAQAPPTTRTGVLSFAVCPLCESNVASIVGLGQNPVPIESRPRGPPSMFSSKRVTGAAGRLSSVVTSCPRSEDVLASSCRSNAPCSCTESFG